MHSTVVICRIGGVQVPTGGGAYPMAYSGQYQLVSDAQGKTYAVYVGNGDGSGGGIMMILTMQNSNWCYVISIFYLNYTYGYVQKILF
jgi:hypothetical protein